MTYAESKNNPPLALFKERYCYDPKTGSLRWKINLNRFVAGYPAGHAVTSGHRRVSVLGKTYSEASICWFLYFGKWPLCVIDHKNHIRGDNRIDNLRESTEQQNSQHRLSKANMSGFRGVSKGRYGFLARIAGINGGRRFLGLFSTAEEAAEEYDRVAVDQFGEFAVTNKILAEMAQTP